MWEEFKDRFYDLRRDLFAAGIVGITLFAAFGLGRLALRAPEKEILIRELFTAPLGFAEKTVRSPMEVFVASIQGAKYYPADCPAAGRIKEENRVWFADEAEARAAGYTPAAACPIR